MKYLRKFLKVMILIIVFAGSTLAGEEQSIYMTLEIPQINWIRIEDRELSMISYAGFPGVENDLVYFVTATGRRPRVITARLDRPLPKGWRIVLEMAPLDVGSSVGPSILSVEEKVVINNVSGIYNLRGTGKISLEADIDALESMGQVKIIFNVREGV